MSMVINNNPTTTSDSSTIPSSSSSPSSFSSVAFPQGFPAAGFLDQCFLCRTKLSPGKDIYMYRGDRAFCSEECRCRQIQLDEEEAFRRETRHNPCSIDGRTTTHPSSSSSSSSSSSKNRRGSRD